MKTTILSICILLLTAPLAQARPINVGDHQTISDTLPVQAMLCSQEGELFSIDIYVQGRERPITLYFGDYRSMILWYGQLYRSLKWN